MKAKSYLLYPAIGRPMTVKGIVAQYILYAAAALLGDLLLFILLYCCGIPHWICMAIVFALGAGIVAGATYCSRTFGEYGLMKQLARRRLPNSIRYPSREPFLNLSIKENGKNISRTKPPAGNRP